MFREYGRRGCRVLSTITNLFPEWNLFGWNLFTVGSFFSSSSSSLSSRSPSAPRSLLRMRLDEDRPVFINHPLKRNPWRFIINDLATNFEEVPRPNETWPVKCILHFEVRGRLTRNRRLDSLTPIFFIYVASTLLSRFTYTCVCFLDSDTNIEIYFWRYLQFLTRI